MKKICSVLLTLALLLPVAVLAEDAIVETFAAEYEMFGTTSAVLLKNDTFIFEREPTDGIITNLKFDSIPNKGEADDSSK